MMKIRVVLLLLFTAIKPAIAQHWVEDKKDFSGAFTQEFRNYSKVYDLDGNRRPSPDIQHWVSKLEAEYGLSNAFSLSVQLPFVHNQVQQDTSYGINTSETVNQLGDALLTLRYMYRVNEEVRACVFFQQSFATAENQAALGLYTGYADYAQLVGGNLRWSTNDRVFASIDIGYRLRHDGFGDEINAKAELGFRMAGQLWVITRSQGVQPLENGEDAVKGGNFGLYQQYEGYWDTGAGLQYISGKWAFSGLISGNFKGQYSPASSIFQIGIRYMLLNRETEVN